MNNKLYRIVCDDWEILYGIDGKKICEGHEVEVYKISDGMFKASKIINGVRMYPYVILGDGRKFYLEY